MTIATYALRNSIKTTYYTFQHVLNEVGKSLARLCLNVKELEDREVLFLLVFSAHTIIGSVACHCSLTFRRDFFAKVTWRTRLTHFTSLILRASASVTNS